MTGGLLRFDGTANIRDPDDFADASYRWIGWIGSHVGTDADVGRQGRLTAVGSAMISIPN